MGLGIGKGSPNQFCWKCSLFAAHLDGSLLVGENPPSQYNINIHLSELVWFCMTLLLTRQIMSPEQKSLLGIGAVSSDEDIISPTWTFLRATIPH